MSEFTKGPLFTDCAGYIYSDGVKIGRGYSVADAALFAASPEMFEALQIADAILSNTPGFSTTNGGRIPVTRVSEAREIVRAALTKARGGENV